ncbi:hypothetical protein ATI61_111308 [Archangium gephyra]|uniref:Uncharacterized protein n=1 Tax=Archangium gephyra TaxID=48 RepID=A0AAC8QHW8_9BACT|nr:hypothetical protein [Archangium gephyra]AKJ07356.1 Hypothetical protein AA314_08982 [Archangium gephyra]REG26757.1 hypothetical protein ATI61_111308 [Archangium gephyra]
MQSATALPGFERLLEVCQGRAHPLKLEPPLPSGGPVEPSVAGQPMDPQLAALYARAGYLWVRDELYLFPARHERRPDLHRVNAHWRKDWAEPFGSLLVFAKDDRLAYCYATVPSLADARGVQPVVWIDVYEALYAVPVASCVDHFFTTYARYLETAPQDSADGEDSPPRRTFPWNASEAIARDAELVRRVQAGHFDFLMKESARAREWVATWAGTSVRR